MSLDYDLVLEEIGEFGQITDIYRYLQIFGD